MRCRVCNNLSTETVGQNRQRIFCYCHRCGLISVPQQYWISVEEEKKRYKQHNNTPENEGYVKFLEQIVDVAISEAIRLQRIYWILEAVNLRY